MRAIHLTILTILALGSGPASADGTAAVAGLEDVARSVCGHTARTADPTGLATALDGVVGDAMGLRDGSTIIGMIYGNDPEGGARMWASTTTANGGCPTLIRMLSQPATATIAEVQ